MTNPIRLGAALRTSLLAKGEVEVLAASGGWGQNDGKARQVNSGDLSLVWRRQESEPPYER
jgi:hypothetical protein